MTQRWEYLVIDLVRTKEWFLPPDGPPGRNIWKETFYVYRPGEQTEARLAYDSENPEEKGVWFMELLAEFGAEGWELVGETVRESVPFDEDMGWKSRFAPVRTRWTFKRPLTEAAGS